MDKERIKAAILTQRSTVNNLMNMSILGQIDKSDPQKWFNYLVTIRSAFISNDDPDIIIAHLTLLVQRGLGKSSSTDNKHIAIIACYQIGCLIRVCHLGYNKKQRVSKITRVLLDNNTRVDYLGCFNCGLSKV